MASSNKAITTICPNLINYFGSRTRPTMRELALLHAAARCDFVYLRGETTRLYQRGKNEDAAQFHARILRGAPDEQRAQLSERESSPIFAALYRGNINLPAKSVSYTLFRESVTPNLAATDLLS